MELRYHIGKKMHSSVKLGVSMCYLTFMDVIAYIQRRQVVRKSSLTRCRKAGTSHEKELHALKASSFNFRLWDF